MSEPNIYPWYQEQIPAVWGNEWVWVSRFVRVSEDLNGFVVLAHDGEGWQGYYGESPDNEQNVGTWEKIRGTWSSTIRHARALAENWMDTGHDALIDKRVDAGEFDEYFAASFGDEPVAVTPEPEGARYCEQCCDPLPVTARADALWCSNACRQKNYRERRRLG